MEPPVKASWWEIVGAWLRIWTPPIGAEIPPVPWRWLAAGAAVLVVAGAVVLVTTGEDRRANQQRQDRADAQGLVDRQRRAAYEQRAIRVRVDPAAAPLAAVQARVLDEARARADAREIAGRPRGVTCEPKPGVRQTPRRTVLDCDVATATIPDGDGNAVGRLSVPFRAILDRRSGALVVCALNPPPAEQALPDPRDLVALPAACRA